MAASRARAYEACVEAHFGFSWTTISQFVNLLPPFTPPPPPSSTLPPRTRDLTVLPSFRVGMHGSDSKSQVGRHNAGASRGTWIRNSGFSRGGGGRPHAGASLLHAPVRRLYADQAFPRSGDQAQDGADDRAEDATPAEPHRNIIDIPADGGEKKKHFSNEDKSTETAGDPNKSDEKMNPHVESMLDRMWDSMWDKADSLHKQKVILDEKELKQEAEAAVLRDKSADVAKKLQAIADQGKENILKNDAIKAKAADLVNRKAKILKDKEEVDVSSREVSEGKVQIASSLKRIAAELAPVEEEKKKVLLERKALQDLVKASQEEKQQSGFFKWLKNGLR